MQTSIQVINGELPQAELDAYVEHARAQYGRTPQTMTITVDGDFVDLDYTFETQPFDRIRRITGYLVGTLDRFNNAKRREEQERVKHTLS